MMKSLSGVKVAILIANGFDEADMTATQRALAAAGAHARIISPEPGLVNSWTGEGWGHHFAIDAQLNTALGADYALLVIPGGTRSIDKLRLTAHTKRFIGGFMAANKPIAVYGSAMPIMVHTEALSGVGAIEDQVSIDGNIMTGKCESTEDKKAFAGQIADFYVSMQSPVRQAA